MRTSVTAHARAVGGHYAVPGFGLSLQTLVLHWNGTAWTRVPAPSRGTDASLGGVAVVSPDNVWAVGSFQRSASETSSALIMRWNGTAWR